jgi:ribosome-interacting GTPase 1
VPANLPPHYFEAEKRYRAASTPQEKIRAIEEMIRIMPKHKGTDRLHGDLKKKLSKLRAEAQKKQSGGKRGYHYHVEKTGAGQVALVGPPNCGKSKLLDTLTNAAPEVADYPFTTRMPTSGMMRFENVQIQLVDLPPISRDFTEGWVFSIIRNADVIFLVLDLSDHDLLEVWDMVFEELRKAKIVPEGRSTPEGVEPGFILKKALVIGNKSDLPEAIENGSVLDELYGNLFDILRISALSVESAKDAAQKGFELLDVLRTYTKTPGKPPDLDDPVILKKGATVLDFAEQIHKDFRQKLKFARIWGKDKHDGQKVQRDYLVVDGDVIEFHI